MSERATCMSAGYRLVMGTDVLALDVPLHGQTLIHLLPPVMRYM